MSIIFNLCHTFFRHHRGLLLSIWKVCCIKNRMDGLKINVNFVEECINLIVISQDETLVYDEFRHRGTDHWMKDRVIFMERKVNRQISNKKGNIETLFYQGENIIQTIPYLRIIKPIWYTKTNVLFCCFKLWEWEWIVNEKRSDMRW